MFYGFVIGLWEGLETFLILGLLAGVSIHPKRSKNITYKQWGGTAVLCSILIATIIPQFLFTNQRLQIFEIILSVLTLTIFSCMVLWLNKQSRVKKSMDSKVLSVLQADRIGGLGILAFLTILSKGVKLTLLLSGNFNDNGDQISYLGAFIGCAAAAWISYSIIKKTLSQNLREFFLIYGTIAILVASRLVFDIIKTMTGYVSIPAVFQILIFAFYIATMLHFLWKGPTLSLKKK